MNYIYAMQFYRHTLDVMNLIKISRLYFANEYNNAVIWTVLLNVHGVAKVWTLWVFFMHLFCWFYYFWASVSIMPRKNKLCKEAGKVVRHPPGQSCHVLNALNRWIRTESRWNKKRASRSSPDWREILRLEFWQKFVSREVDRNECVYSNWLERVFRCCVSTSMKYDRAVFIIIIIMMEFF